MRLDGWKSIGAHFGRERSTAIRWASDRGMPVHRIPGAGRGSVFALTEELDAWLEADKSHNADEPAHPVRSDAARSVFARVGLRIGVPLALAAIGLSAFALTREDAETPQLSLPADKDAAALYLDARSDWAERRPESISRAIDKLQQVVARDPGFAPAYAALADCYVLAREFGSLPDAEAFARAQSATDAALRIDPENPAALRAKGFLDYWWRRDGKSAASHFKRSLALGPQSAQTHFWYGNVLIDNGDFVAGLKELDEARLLEPASVAIQADIAWANWSAGQEQQAQSALEALRTDHPNLATIRDYLSVIYLANGDIPGFVREFHEQAQIRKEADFIGQTDRLSRALTVDQSSVLPMLVTETLREAETGDRRDLAWPAFVASSGENRSALLRLLKTSDARKESWGSAGLVRKIKQRWAGDREITSLLEKRAAPSLVPDETPK